MDRFSGHEGSKHWLTTRRRTPHATPIPGLAFADDPPRSERLPDGGGTWFGYRIRLCNESAEQAFTFVARDAYLVFSDGRRAAAARGFRTFLDWTDVPQEWMHESAWIDSETLRPGECTQSWLLFGTSSQAEPLVIPWHGRTLDVTDVEAPVRSELPNDIDGVPVLTGRAISRHISSATDSAPFLIGGHIRFVQADCGIPDDFPSTPLLAPCNDGYILGTFGGHHLKLVLPDEEVGVRSDKWAVLRVHVHDPRAADCPPTYRERCERAVVVEDVVWP